MLLSCAQRKHWVLAWLLVVCIATMPNPALTFSPASPEIKEKPEWAADDLWWSADAPVTSHLAENSDYTASAKILLDHFAIAENAIMERLRYGREKENTVATELIKPCNYDLKDWVHSTDVFFFRKGWSQPDGSCVTDMLGAQTKQDEAPRYSVDELYDAAYMRGTVLKSEARAITDKAIGDFTDPDINFNGVFTRLNQRCVIHPTGAVRVNGRWNLITSIYNVNVHDSVPKGGRHVIVEHHRVGDDGKLTAPVQMTLNRIARESRGETFTEWRVENGTTAFQVGAGHIEPSHFSPISPEENKAVQDALILSDFYLQQAEDALTPSSVAILALPLFLNLVPVALIAEVSTLATVIYALLSDVLTVIPLAIKGCELIFVGNRKVRSVGLRMSSAITGERAESAAADLWTAECSVEGHMLSSGIAFVALSMTFLVVGVVAELVATVYVRRKRWHLIQAIISQMTSTKLQGGLNYDASSQGSAGAGGLEGGGGHFASDESELKPLKAS